MKLSVLIVIFYYIFNCHCTRNHKLQGQSFAYIKDHPYAVKLDAFLSVNKVEEQIETCGGTIINQQWILSAAHCVMSNPMAIAAKVHAGIQAIDERGEVSDIKMYRCHPEYKVEASLDAKFTTDLCLYKTMRPFNFSDEIKPAKLVKDKNQYSSFTKASITGFGNMKGFRSHMRLRKIEMRLGSESECNEYWKGKFNISSSLCLITHDDQDFPCIGDFGTGIIGKENDGSPVIVGVAMSSDCKSYVFGPNILNQLEWINEVLNNDAKQNEVSTTRQTTTTNTPTIIE